MVFTAWPLMAKALFDQDINPAKNMDGTRFRSLLPKLYYVGQKSTVFNWYNYFLWVSEGILHSLIVFLIPYFVFNKSILVGNSGHDTDLWTFSITSFTAIIIVSTSSLTFHLDCKHEAHGSDEVLHWVQLPGHLHPLHGYLLHLRMGVQLPATD